MEADLRVIVVTPPDPIVSYADAAARLRIASDGEQADVEAMIAAATAMLDGPDGWLGRAIGEQTLELRCDRFPGCDYPLRLPLPPIAAMVSVKYLDADGVEQTIAGSDYELIGDELWPTASASWPTTAARPEAVRIRYSAGYDDVPPNITAAILLMTGDLYANRETAVTGTIASAVPMSTTVEALLAPLRIYR
jgi:uncharacterized phiE125 gp8 family phage protein